MNFGKFTTQHHPRNLLAELQRIHLHYENDYSSISRIFTIPVGIAIVSQKPLLKMKLLPRSRRISRLIFSYYPLANYHTKRVILGREMFMGWGRGEWEWAWSCWGNRWLNRLSWGWDSEIVSSLFPSPIFFSTFIFLPPLTPAIRSSKPKQRESLLFHVGKVPCLLALGTWSLPHTWPGPSPCTQQILRG